MKYTIEENKNESDDWKAGDWLIHIYSGHFVVFQNRWGDMDEFWGFDLSSASQVCCSVELFTKFKGKIIVENE